MPAAREVCAKEEEEMKKKYVLYLTISIAFISQLVIFPVAAAGITGVNPSDGTIGTKFTISGSGFGEKKGEVLLGNVNCKVLKWTNTAITGKVSRPQLAGAYCITVVAPGGGKSSNPMTFSSFTMREPEFLPGELIKEGDTVTIPGAFFGDKQGDIRFAYRDNGVVVDNAKIVDWSMDAIRIRLPDGLTGKFLLQVRNAIGSDYAVFDITSGKLTLLGMTWPSGYGKVESEYRNARGIPYNGTLYVWSTFYTSNVWQQMIHPKFIDRVEYRTFQNDRLSDPSELWEARTKAEPAPVIVQYYNGPQKMFVFRTDWKDENIYFTRLNGTVWEDGRWIAITDHATGQYITTKAETWEVAPVYDPGNHRLYLYYAKEYNDYLYVVYSDDYGNTWHNPGKVIDSPVTTSAPSAVLLDNTSGYNILLAVQDAYFTTPEIRICHMGLNWVDSSEVLPLPADDIGVWGRPFLTDVGNGNIALLYGASPANSGYCLNEMYHISVFNKTNGVWGEPYHAQISLPDLGFAEGEYLFDYQPNGVMDPATNTFWLFYGFGLCGGAETDDTNNGPWWMFNSIPTPGA